LTEPFILNYKTMCEKIKKVVIDFRIF
jgi:hypothetical protein